MLNSAVEDGLLAASPALGLARPYRLGMSERVAPKALEPAQVGAILEGAAQPLRMLCSLLYRTGLRSGEALALRWEDVDLERRRLRVERSLREDRSVSPRPKSGKARAVDLSAGLCRELELWRAASREAAFASGQGRESPWLFAASDGRPLSPRPLRCRFKRLLQRLGLPEHYSLHSFRHTYAVALLREGVSPVYVQQQLGHASIRLTVDVYGSWARLDGRGAVDLLDAVADL